MKNSRKKYQSLLQFLSKDEVEDLIFEEELRQKGYRFHYFIDSHDIQSYCFPFGVLGEGNKDPIRPLVGVDYILDEQITYYHFIDFDKRNLLLLDEHLDEHRRLRVNILYWKQKGIQLLSNYEQIVKHYKNQSRLHLEEYQTLKQIEKFDLSVLVSIALGSMRIGIQRSNHLANTRLMFHDGQLQEKNYPESFIEKVSMKPKNNDLAEDFLLHLKDSYEEEKDANWLVSKFNDCKTLARVIACNTSDESPNDLFCFMSSTGSGVRLANIGRDTNLYSKVESKPFCPVRTISQRFLMLLISNDTDEEKLDTLERIKGILEFKHEVKGQRDREEQIDRWLFDRFESRIQHFREGYENASLLINLNDFAEAIESDAFKKQGLLGIRKILNNLLAWSKANKQQIERTRDTKFVGLEREEEFLWLLRRGLENVESGTAHFKILSGKDSVNSQYHHLPIVYWLENKQYQKAINHFTDFLLELDKEKRNSVELVKAVQHSIDIGAEKAQSAEEKLIRCLVLLIMDGGEIEQDSCTEEVDKRLDQILDSELKQNDSLRKDFLYMHAWVARRQLKLSEADKHIQEGLILAPEDPRFFHGMALNKYCYFIRCQEEAKTNKPRASRLQSEGTKHLLDSLTNCRKAIEYYLERPVHSFAISKSISALLNMECYLLSLMSEDLDLFGNEAKNMLAEARGKLVALKEREGELYFDIPEFMHTEAYLELLEAKQYKSSEKAQQALIRIREAIKKNPPSEELYLDLLNKIQEISKKLTPHLNA